MDFMYLQLFVAQEARRGQQRPCLIGPNCRPHMLPARLQWGRWRRLLLRFFTSTFLRGWQIFMEVVRTPQLREARRLQTRREQLEKQIYDLQQQEQRMVATAAATSSMSTTGQLNIARREERQQPLACIMGRGKYLVPQLEASPQCPHSKTTHGANRMMSYQRCLDCQQEQQMPLTPLKDLQHWNHNLAFLQTDFLKRMVNLELEKKKQEATGSLGAQPKGLAKAQPKSVAKATAVKSRAQPVPTLIEPKDEEEETFLNNAVFIGDEEDMVMEQYTNPPPHQPCSRCQRGLVSLMRDTANQQLVWNCNNPACAFCCPDVNDILEPAQGVFLCPQCQAAELLPISVGDQPDETQLQCCNCGQAIYMFEMALVYSRLGRFQEEKLGWAIG
jgi:hypothetical protein